MNLKGKIVLIPFPFTNLSSKKLRPCLVICEGDYDVIVCPISSKINKYNQETCILIDENHPEYELTGLKVSSIIILNKVATIHKSLIYGILGELGDDLKNEVNSKLSKIYKL